MIRRHGAWLLALAALVAPSAAHAASDVTPVTDLNTPPAGYRMTGRAMLAIAGAVPKVRAAIRAHPGAYPGAYRKPGRRWQASWFDRHVNEIAQVAIDDTSGRVVEAWTGPQVAWSMARGYPGAFGRKSNALYIWIPLCLLFVAPFVTRRPRMLHLDLLALLSFSISLAFFNRANIDASVPLAYPPLVYLLGRLLWIGLRRDRPAPPLRLGVPVAWLGIALVFLMGFRVGLNVTDANVIDVGYASLVGADRIEHGSPVYGHFPANIERGDTYGPVAYESYIPFAGLLGFSGRWDDLPAAHAAAVFFDLLCALLLFLLGRRIRGPSLGTLLAYLWAAYPFTLFTMNSGSNDELVAAMVLLALFAATRPFASGSAAALAGLTKFAPLALVPLLALDNTQRRARAVALFAVGLACTAVIVSAPVLAHGSLHAMFDRTITYQADRASPFSVWGLYGIGGWQTVVQVAAVALALAVAVLPRRRDLVGLASLSGAVLIAVELGVTHWFYLYVPWFAGAAFVALLGRHQQLLDRVRA